ncbi:MAG: demethylmenaquinone methyltransferase [Firmicutes bacterium]|nr:demethylmenaquinone methyltransferase [Bacillota bacterium]
MSQPVESQVWKIFESIADYYDQMNAVISFKQHQTWRKKSLTYINFKQDDYILDLCCGTGDWTVLLAKRIEEKGKVFALDFSPSMLAHCREKIKRSQLHNVKLYLGNALQIPFNNDFFDIVTIGFGLRNTTNYRQVLQEMYRVLKPAGQAVCLDMSLPTIPVFKQLYLLYFCYVMPLLGKILTNNYQAYSWLQKSTLHFPDKERLADLFTSVGFKWVQVYSFCGGIIALHIGIK